MYFSLYTYMTFIYHLGRVRNTIQQSRKEKKTKSKHAHRQNVKQYNKILSVLN